jgi:hypothetical protein
MNEGLKDILDQLYEQTPDIEALYEALISLVQKGELTLDDIKTLDRHYVSKALFDPQSFMTFIRLIAEKVDYYAPKHLAVLLREMYRQDPATITRATVEMITDDLGKIRFAGRVVWDNLDLGHSSFDPLELSEEMQVRFAISIVQDMMSPEFRAKSALCLFGSKFKLVRDTVLCSLTPYAENYLSIIKKEMYVIENVKNEEAKLFRQVLEIIDSQFASKAKCKELQAFSTQYDVYDECRKAESAYLQSLINKVEAERGPSIIDLFPKVLLARGGGFRDENGHARGVAKFSSHGYLPMMFYSNSLMENLTFEQKIMSDWSKATDLCEIL